jgi:hypothetical protein
MNKKPEITIGLAKIAVAPRKNKSNSYMPDLVSVAASAKKLAQKVRKEAQYLLSKSK